MSDKKKTGLLKFAIITAATTALIAIVAGIAFYARVNQPKHLETAKFLHSKFVAGEYLEGFTPGTAEYGFSLEALSQLQFASSIDTSKAENFLLSGDLGYLYSPDQILIPGLAGKYLYASKVAGTAVDEKVLGELVGSITQVGGTLPEPSSTFDYAWAILGLYAQGQSQLASQLSNQLATLARADGGFGFDQTSATTASSTDATAMAILALLLTVHESETSRVDNQSVIDAATAFLRASLAPSGDHWVAFEAEDINGTALALMALTEAEGSVPQNISGWLESQLRSDGGIGSPWVQDGGDQYATAQGYLSLEGKTYLDLLGH